MATVTTHKTTDPHGDDGSGLAAVVNWRHSAPILVRKAYLRGRNGDGWAAWAKHLARRKTPTPPASLLPTMCAPLQCALPESMTKRGTQNLLRRLHRLVGAPSARDAGLEAQLVDWLRDATGPEFPEGYALEALAWCHALPRLASNVPESLWWDLLRHLLATVADAAKLRLADDPVVHQLLAGELPLSVAYLLPEIQSAAELAPAAGRALSTGLVEMLDDQGLPHAAHLPHMQPLLACWTRAWPLAQKLKHARWSADAVRQYRRAVRVALHLARYDGTQALGNDSAAVWRDLFDAALAFSPDAGNAAIAGKMLPPSRRTRGSKSPRSKLPPPALHSESSAVALLRPHWGRCEPRLTVAYPNQSFSMELQCGRDLVWSGPWQSEIRCNGQAVTPAGSWDATCWVSDADADYLELAMDLSGGFRLERQIFMARRDGWLLLADAVLGPDGPRRLPAKLDYRTSLPLARGIRVDAARQTHECLLVSRKPCAMVMPLALGEWRCDPRPLGSLEHTEAGLQLRIARQGHSLYVPLLVDLTPRRMKGPLTWRQLTVAESLVVQPQDVAVGYRVMLGQQQWLVYRSLTPPANRTLLGHNLSSETLVARFDRSGEVEPLVEIE